MPFCRYCGTQLPQDCPDAATSCEWYCDWKARARGGRMSAEEIGGLKLRLRLCRLTVLLRQLPARPPELD